MVCVAIIGSVGVPGTYGGFETLADNLVGFHSETKRSEKLIVYCSSRSFSSRPTTYKSAALRYVNFEANGLQSVPYDVISMVDAIRMGCTHIILLGVSGGLFLPLLRLFSKINVYTNIDGIEWRREKWGVLAKLFLRLSELSAVRFSHRVIADNFAVADYVNKSYGISCEIISYGGDHAVDPADASPVCTGVSDTYALALCRIEPENNVAMILEAFENVDIPLVFVGNWDRSKFGRELKSRYSQHPLITILDPVYEPQKLRAIRSRASMYIHGHSAGGTNPSLVEMMHFGIPVFAYDCIFNRCTTEGKARYFDSSATLANLIRSTAPSLATLIGTDMIEVARRCYTWDHIGNAYFALLDR